MTPDIRCKRCGCMIGNHQEVRGGCSVCSCLEFQPRPKP